MFPMIRWNLYHSTRSAPCESSRIALPPSVLTRDVRLNHDYAIKQGVDYVYLLHDAEEEPMGVHDENRPMCKHPSEGWRAASWCKLPAVWHMIQKFPGHQYFVYIGAFRRSFGQNASADRYMQIRMPCTGTRLCPCPGIWTT